MTEMKFSTNYQILKNFEDSRILINSASFLEFQNLGKNKYFIQLYFSSFFHFFRDFEKTKALIKNRSTTIVDKLILHFLSAKLIYLERIPRTR